MMGFTSLQRLACVVCAILACVHACGELPLNQSLVQCWNGTAVPTAATPDACRQHCCDASSCLWWGYAGPESKSHNGCWVSSHPSYCESNRAGWTGESWASLPVTPPPSPPPIQPLPEGVVRLDQAKPELAFEGTGMIVDASSRFLYDYPAQQQEEILDFLFKPYFGASLSICKVEIGGDDQQTDGTTASIRHRDGEDYNFNRSHIWWAMEQAKQRNPNMLFYGLAWGFPAYLGSFYSNATAQYLTDWVLGAARVHDLTVSILGLWNERQPCRHNKDGSWDCSLIDTLRQHLDAAGLTHVQIAGSDTNMGGLDPLFDEKPPIDIVASHASDPLPSWQEEERVRQGWRRWRSEGEDNPSSMAMHMVNDYLTSNVTASIEWPATQGYYPQLPFGTDSMSLHADSPWSGHYYVTPRIWIFAHVNQFIEPQEWRYLEVGVASGALAHGGSLVSLSCSKTGDIVVIAQTVNASADQPITFQLPSSLAAKSVEHWQSLVTSNKTKDYFVKQAAITVAKNSFTVKLSPNTLTTLTTRLGYAHKGTVPSPSPPAVAFPSPYTVNYTTLPLYRQGPYHTDQRGSFEIDEVGLDDRGLYSLTSRVGGTARGLLQTVTTMPIAWVFATPRPASILGDPTWVAVKVYAEGAMLEASTYETTTLFDCSQASEFTVPGEATKKPNPIGGTFISVGLRVMVGGNICNAGKVDTGYWLLVHANSTFSVTAGSQKVVAGGPLHHSITGTQPGESLIGVHLSLALFGAGTTIVGYVNDQVIVTFEGEEFWEGFAGIASGWHRTIFTELRVTPEFEESDN
eukprot:m.180703 g.180703  ORF g.180703 m.180703 type:complete len:801 (-) comp16862_c0_seq2:20-2422(-)